MVIANNRPNVLIVTRMYYPSAAIGSHRSGKFSKYLPGLGWKPTILTIQDRYCTALHPLVDRSLLKQIPNEVEVIRTGYMGVEVLKQLARSILPRRRGCPPRGPQAGSPWPVSAARGLAPWVEVPDGVWWIPYGLCAGVGAARRCDVIWATSPAPGALCIAALLSKLAKKPLVVDFRDPWLMVTDRPYATTWHKVFDVWCERSVLRRASQIVMVTEEMAADYRRRYPEYADIISVIHNGYDEEDFRCLSEARASVSPNGPVRIGYLGAVYGGRHQYMRRFLEGVKRFIASENAPDVHICFRGAAPEVVEELLRSTGTLDLADIGGPVAHRESLALMSRMDILLLVGSDAHRPQLPGKIFEYLGAGKPILGVAPEGAIVTFIRKHQVGLAVNSASGGNLEQAIRTLIQDYSFYTDQIRKVAAQFTRRSLTRRLVDVLTRACAEKG